LKIYPTTQQLLTLASPKMNVKLEGAFLKAAKEALAEVLDGLDTNTLRLSPPF
jgi:hypothetical protein